MATIHAPADCELDASTLIPLVVSSFQPPDVEVVVLGRSPFPGINVRVVGIAPDVVPKRCVAIPVGSVVPVV